ncbi:MAG: hypothetical protein AB8B60_02290 [Sulfitobacter sp.]
MMQHVGAALLTAAVLAAPAAQAETPLNLSGQLNLGYRYYVDDGQYQGQADAGFYPFVGFQLNGGFDLGAGEVVFQFSGLNDDDNDRSVFSIQKAFYARAFDNWDLVVGYNVENWGVSNGRTIVNVLNAKDRANQVNSSNFIGTPMVNANIFTGVGTFSFYALAGDVQDNFGGRATRQRGPFYTNEDFARYEDDNSIDLALRFTNNYAIGNGSLDIGASIYHGTSRQALRLPGCITGERGVTAEVCEQFNRDVLAAYEAGANIVDSAIAAGAGGITAFTPYYHEIRQVGLTAVYAQGNTRLQFEGFVREAAGETFGAAIVGGEQAFKNFLGGDGTMRVALEYHYDDRSDRQPIVIFDDELFLGLNYAPNDTNDSKYEIGVFYDLEKASKVYSFAMSRRVGDRVRVAFKANHTTASNARDPLATVNNNSWLQLTVSTFF